MANSATKAEMSQSTQSGQDTKTDYLVILILAIAGLIVAGLVSLDTGGRGVILFTLGALLGASFLFFQYGFASGWRLLITQGDTRPMGYHFLLVGLCSLVFLPVSFLDLGASGNLAPISISLIMGSSIFGIGMQLAIEFSSLRKKSIKDNSRCLILYQFISSILNKFILTLDQLKKIDSDVLFNKFSSDKKHTSKDYVLIIPNQDGYLYKEYFKKDDIFKNDFYHAFKQVLEQYEI